MSQSWWHWGKFLYSVPLSITGLIYLFRPQGAVESLVSFIPGGLSLIYVAGALWLILGLALAFDFKSRFALLGIMGLILVQLMIVHIPAAYTGEHLNVVWFEILRNLSLLGGAFLVMAHDGHREKYKEESHDHDLAHSS